MAIALALGQHFTSNTAHNPIVAYNRRVSERQSHVSECQPVNLFIGLSGAALGMGYGVIPQISLSLPHPETY